VAGRDGTWTGRDGTGEKGTRGECMMSRDVLINSSFFLAF
jgi:hypothetical protein